jgi:hypothetical protein
MELTCIYPKSGVADKNKPGIWRACSCYRQTDACSPFPPFAAGLDLAVRGDDMDVMIGGAAYHQPMLAKHVHPHHPPLLQH